jgi:hypothetical protein
VQTSLICFGKKQPTDKHARVRGAATLYAVHLHSRPSAMSSHHPPQHPSHPHPHLSLAVCGSLRTLAPQGIEHEHPCAHSLNPTWPYAPAPCYSPPFTHTHTPAPTFSLLCCLPPQSDPRGY